MEETRSMHAEHRLFEQSLSSPTFWNSLSNRVHHNAAQRIRSVEFQVLGDEEIRKLSAVRVHTTTLYDKYVPKTGGMNDLRMGTIDRKYECSTCHNDLMTCPGHCGHIELSTSIYHPAFVSNLLKILRCICPVCYRLIVPLTSSNWYTLSEKLGCSLRRTRLQIISSYLKSRRHCCNEGCGFPMPAYTLSSFCIRRKWTEKAERKIRAELDADRAQELLAPLDPQRVRKIISLAKPSALDHLGLSEENHPRKYVMSVLLVPPPCIRPAVNMSVSNRTRGQDDLTQKLVEILKASNRLGKLLATEAKAEEIQTATDILQGFVCLYFNSDLTGTKIPARKRTMATQKSLVGRLKGKSGRMRGNLQGKRVDFSSRSVISGDSHIDPDEIGVPVDIALSLTFTDTVNQWNLSKLQAMVTRGPDVLNGAKSIISGRTGAEIALRYAKRTNPILKLQVGDRVRRYMQTGDIVLFNRQPSLREKSIMAHRVVVMPEKTFRLNLCCTSPYNADFDGDEMNLHFLQSVTASTEARTLACVSEQILNAQNNKPCMGIIQDSLVGAYLMTSKNTFLTRGQVMQLMMKMRHVESGSRRVPPPCILKPRPLWSGKQVFSMLLPPISFAKKQGSGAGSLLSDTTVVIRQGQLLCGQLCKRTLGSCSGGVIHNTCLLRSPDRAVKFMGDCQRVVNEWLQSYGLSVGITDCLVSPGAKSRVRSATAACFRHVYAIEEAGREEGVRFRKREQEASKRLGKMLAVAGTCVEDELDPQRNGLVAMVRSGSKGSSINISQIMGLVGQQSVEGKRIYKSFRPEGRVLSSVLPSEARDAGSHGFVRHSYVDGLEPDEMFFHTMGGREGLVDTSVKTADTGYLQRRIVKATEGCVVQYDGSVRGPTGMVIETVYGTDGCDASRLRKVSMAFLRTPERDLKRTHLPSERQQIGRLIRECLKVKITPYELELDTTAYLPVDPALLLLQTRTSREDGPTTLMTPEAIVERIGRLLDHLHHIETKTRRRTLFLRTCVAWYFRAKNLKGLSGTDVDELADAVKDTFERVAIAPGAMVGILAATSVGEPCTQLTLNTFHFAGVMSKNVTLGVPRMKELIDGRRKQKAVFTDVYLTPEVASSRSACRRLKQRLKACDLAACVVEASVHHDPVGRSSFTDRFVREFVTDEEEDRSYAFVIRFRLDTASLHRRGLTPEHVCRRIDDALGNADAYLLLVTQQGCIELRMKKRKRKRAGEEEEEKKDCRVPHALQKSLSYRLMRHLLSSVSLCGLPSATDVSAHKTATGEWYLQTTGMGIMQALPDLDEADWYRSHSTDVFEVFETLGIEAAACLLFREMRSVISFDGGYVDARHIFIITNIMTLRGGIMGLNRHGLNKLDSSALVRATFEETSDIFFDAAAFSEKSKIASVSDSIIFGQRVPGGTGLVQPILAPEYKEQCALEDKARQRKRTQISRTRKRSHLVSTRFIPEAERPDEPVCTPPYNPTSPTSPPYNPTSPGPYRPSSPPYNPTSPGPYRPSSPPYNPTSPNGYWQPTSKKSPAAANTSSRKQKAWGIQDTVQTSDPKQTPFIPSSPFIRRRETWAPSTPILGRRSGLALPTVTQAMDRIIPSIMSTERLTSREIKERPLRDAVYDAKTGVMNLERLKRFLEESDN